MKVYSYENHIFNNDIINNIIYTSKNTIQNKENIYSLINIATYNKDFKLYNKDINNLYYLSINNINYVNLFIPNLNIHKIIFTKVNNEISLITNILLEYNNIYDLYVHLTNLFLNDLNIINNLLINISYFEKYDTYLYYNINTLDNISSHILYFDNYINSLKTILYFLNNTNNEKNLNINNKLNIIKDKLDKIKFYYNTIKTNTIEKITYKEAKVTKILTYIATIFLPLSFIISFISLPHINLYFIKNKKNIYYIIFFMFISVNISIFVLNRMN